jgi:hypothetical protein
MNRNAMPVRSYCYTCTSGNTSGPIVPFGYIAHLEEVEIDTAAISGAISTVKVQLRDTYTPQGGSATTETKKQVSLDCGDVVHIDTDGDVEFKDTMTILTNVSGVVATIALAYE